MPLWLTYDKHGFSLFQGDNPPDWENGMSTSNKIEDGEYLCELLAKDVPNIGLTKGETVRVRLAVIETDK